MCILIPCAGEGRRWQNFLGSPKHLAEVEGARLLDRLVYRVHTASHTEPICIIATDERYRITGTLLCPPNPDRLGAGVDKIVCSRPYWSTDSRTWIIWGDLWLSRAGAHRIFASGQSGMRWYGRAGPSARNHKAWGEIWGLSFAPEHFPGLLAACAHAAAMERADYIATSRARTVYSLLHGHDVRDWARPSPDWTEIDDETEDFDSPRDLAGWQWGRAQRGER